MQDLYPCCFLLQLLRITRTAHSVLLLLFQSQRINLPPVPLPIFLVVRRHVLLNGAILIEYAVQFEKETKLASIDEYLHGDSCQAHIQFLPDILKGT